MNTCTWRTVVVILLAAAALAPLPAMAQSDPPAKPAAASVATINDFSWLAGHWRGKLKTGPVAEIRYSDPAGGLMMAMFRLMDGDKLLVLEYMTLRETPEGMEMRVRHFDPALTALEKEDAIVLKLAEHDGLRSVFENPVHSRPKRSVITLTSENSHTVRSEIINDKGEASYIEVAWERVEEAATPKTSGAAEAAPANPLDPLAHLVGGQWRGELKMLDGTVIRARHVFEWGLGGTILKSKTYGAVGDGPEQLVYEGVYGWHPEKKAIVFREFSTFNSMNEGTVMPEGNALHYGWAEHSSKGVTEYRETLRFPDTDRYVSEGDRKTGDGWEKCVESAFRREAATKTDPTAKEMK